MEKQPEETPDEFSRFEQEVRTGYGDLPTELEDPETDKGQQIINVVQELRESGLDSIPETDFIDYLLTRVPDLTHEDIAEHFPFTRIYGDES